MAGVLFYLHKNEETKLNAEWEKTRIQTWHLLNIQLDRKNKISYDDFKKTIWPFVWETPEIKETPVIDWEEKDRRDKERMTMNYKAEELFL